MDSKDFTFRPYREGDEPSINEMFNEVFGQDRSLEHWCWKYRDNPYGSHKIALAFAPDGTLAAHYGGYPVKIVLYSGGKKQEYLAYHLGDKMTRKVFRGIGFGRSSILSLTFREFQRNFGREAFFSYGFGTHHSLRFGLLFLDYVDIEPVAFRRVSVGRLRKDLGISPVRKFLSLRRVREAGLFDRAWDDFFLRVAPFYRFLIKRDSEYLNWRYTRRPDRRYLILTVTNRGRPSGWSVFYREGSRLIWGDALFEPHDFESVRFLLSYLLRNPCSAGAETIEGWFPERPSWWDGILRSLYFERESEPSDLHLTGPITDEVAVSLLRRDFYYTIGDSDLF